MVFNFIKQRYQALKQALSKTRLGAKLKTLFQSPLDAKALEQIEQLLYEADLGHELAEKLTNIIHQEYKARPKSSDEHLLETLRNALLSEIQLIQQPELNQAHLPRVVLIVGVNGNGKTTTVARLANRFKNEGKKVLVAAADTFRAAAVEQLTLWADKCHFDIVKGAPKGDPAAVAYDACAAAKARQSDLVLIDTAGRLHTKTPLMQELEKVRRACRKLDESAPHETLLVLDATTGANGIDQALTFQKFVPLTGIVLTKLDGTAKGGIAIAIQQKLKLPIKWIGIGEGENDLEPFDPQSFVSALLNYSPDEKGE